MNRLVVVIMLAIFFALSFASFARSEDTPKIELAASHANSLTGLLEAGQKTGSTTMAETAAPAQQQQQQAAANPTNGTPPAAQGTQPAKKKKKTCGPQCRAKKAKAAQAKKDADAKKASDEKAAADEKTAREAAAKRICPEGSTNDCIETGTQGEKKIGEKSIKWTTTVENVNDTKKAQVSIDDLLCSDCKTVVTPPVDVKTKTDLEKWVNDFVEKAVNSDKKQEVAKNDKNAEATPTDPDDMSDEELAAQEKVDLCQAKKVKGKGEKAKAVGKLTGVKLMKCLTEHYKEFSGEDSEKAGLLAGLLAQIKQEYIEFNDHPEIAAANPAMAKILQDFVSDHNKPGDNFGAQWAYEAGVKAFDDRFGDVNKIQYYLANNQPDQARQAYQHLQQSMQNPYFAQQYAQAKQELQGVQQNYYGTLTTSLPQTEADSRLAAVAAADLKNNVASLSQSALKSFDAQISKAEGAANGTATAGSQSTTPQQQANNAVNSVLASNQNSLAPFFRYQGDDFRGDKGYHTGALYSWNPAQDQNGYGNPNGQMRPDAVSAVIGTSGFNGGINGTAINQANPMVFGGRTLTARQ